MRMSTCLTTYVHMYIRVALVNAGTHTGFC